VLVKNITFYGQELVVSQVLVDDTFHISAKSPHLPAFGQAVRYELFAYHTGGAKNGNCHDNIKTV
jgi:hypothetical protein